MSTTEGQLINTAKLKTVKLRAASLTDVGRRRSENQDSYGYVHTERASLFVVADGMGGARGGGTASAMAVNLIVDSALDERGELTLRSLQRAIRMSNRVIYSRSQQDSQLSGMGTTVVALAFVDNLAIVAHVGDSRIYLWREGHLTQLTRDHTLVQELVDTGAIPQQDAATHPIAHMLTRSLGPTEAIGVEIHSLPKPAQPGDKFLLCSDGLYNHVSNDQIAEALSTKDAEAAVSTLVQQALDGGGSDNVTIEIIEVCSLHDERVPTDGVKGSLRDRFVASEIDVREFNGMTLQGFVESLNGNEDLDDDFDEAEQGAGSNGTSAAGRSAQEEARPSVSQPSLTAAARPAEPERERDALFGDSGEPVESPAVAEAPQPKRVQFVFGMLFAGLLCAGLFIVFSRPTPRVTVPQPPVVQPTPEVVQEEMTEEMMAFDPATSEVPQPAASESSGPATQEDPAVPDTNAVQTQPDTPISDPGTSVPPDTIVLPDEPPVEPAEIAAPPVYDPATDDFSDAQTDGMKRFAEVIAMADDIGVPPTPRLSLGVETALTPDQPIVWENESRLVQKVFTNQGESGSPANEAAQAEAVPPKLRTVEEDRDLAIQKAQARDRISDIDMKLAMLVFGTKDQAKNKQTRLDMELNRSAEAMAALQKDLKDSLVRLSTWEALQKKSLEVEPLKLADDVAGVSDEVKEKRAEYRDTSESYLSAVEQWQSNPKDAQSAASMAALGREIKAKRVELELTVGKAVARGVAVSKHQVEQLRFSLGNLESKRAQLGRQSGLLRSFVPTTVQRRQEMQRKYLEERALLLKNLNQLRAVLSDEQENKFRLDNSALFYSPVG